MTKTNPGPIASLHQIRAGDEVAMPEAVPAGTWAIDPSASSLQFVARHMMVSKVRGRFLQFQGRILTGTDPSDASVEAWADAASLSTGDEARDEHLRSADFFDVERWPRLTLVGALKPSSTRRRLLAAQLTIRDVTCPVDFQVTLTGLHGGELGVVEDQHGPGKTVFVEVVLPGAASAWCGTSGRDRPVLR